MSETTASTERVCPACGEGRLEARESTQQVEHAGVEETIPLHYAVCDVCGSEVAEAEEARANKRAMMTFRKHAEGLLTGSEMREARRALRLTQSQAAQLFGGGKVAFSRYENDDIAQSEAMDSLVRVCLARAETLSWLASHKGVPLPADTSVRPHAGSLTGERISAIKSALQRQIASGQAEKEPRDPVRGHASVVDIQRWRKSAA